MSGKNILIIVPAYNEEGNIKQTVESIRSLDDSYDLVIVNDGSVDRTAQVAASTGSKVVSLPFNLGIGGAVQAGFQFAQCKGYDAAVQVDGDGQHDVRYVETLIQPVLDHQADMVIGSRFVGSQSGYRSSFIRRIGINFFANLTSFLTGSRITDPTSGFRAYSKRAIKLFADNYPTDYPEPEAVVIASRSGLKCVEVPVQMNERVAGRSSIRYLLTLYYMIKVTFAILLNLLKRKRLVEA